MRASYLYYKKNNTIITKTCYDNNISTSKSSMNYLIMNTRSSKLPYI